MSRCYACCQENCKWCENCCHDDRPVKATVTPTKKAGQPAWTLTDALRELRDLEHALQPVGWHVSLAGSVLHQDYSTKDLDIVMFPHQKTTAKPLFFKVRRLLKTLGWKQTRTKDALHKFWRTYGSKDTKHVEVWQTPDGRRVDLLVLS